MTVLLQLCYRTELILNYLPLISLNTKKISVGASVARNHQIKLIFYVQRFATIAQPYEKHRQTTLWSSA